MTKPNVTRQTSFDNWRIATNTVSDNVGDPATLTSADGGDTYAVTDLVSFVSDLKSKKVKRSGDTITSLVVSTTLQAGATTLSSLSVSGNSTLSGTANNVGTVTTGTWNGTLISTTYGGTGLNSYAAGDTIYASGVNTLAKLTGNTTATKKYMYMTSGIPGWSQLTTAEISDLSSWVGSSSITTLGTVTTGVWSGTAVGTTKGGTGLSSIGTGNQLLGVNAGASALEYKGFQSSGGSVVITYPSAGLINLEANATSSGSTITGDELVGQRVLIGNTSGTLTTHSFEVRPYSGITNVIAARSSHTDGSSIIFSVNTAGNTSIAGTLGVTGTSTLAAVNSGNHAVTGTLSSTSDFSVNTNKFTVAGTTGNTAVLGDFAVNTNKFTVAAASGNTVVAGTLGVTGTSTLAAVNSGNLSVTGTLGASSTSTLAAINASGDFNVNSGKFTVASASGNTVVSGTLNVNGITTLATASASTYTTTGDSSFGTTAPAATVTNTSTFGTNAVLATFAVTNTTSGSAVDIARVSATTYRSAEFIVQATEGSAKYHSATIKAIHNGSSADYTEYAAVSLGGLVGTFAVVYSASELKLQVTQTTTNSTTYKVTAILTKV